jgi:hypothetical protein
MQYKYPTASSIVVSCIVPCVPMQICSCTVTVITYFVRAGCDIKPKIISRQFCSPFDYVDSTLAPHNIAGRVLLIIGITLQTDGNIFAIRAMALDYFIYKT